MSVYAITLAPFVFVSSQPDAVTVVHEEIHGKQAVETVLVLAPVIMLTATSLGWWWLAILGPVIAFALHNLLYVALWLVGVVVFAIRGAPLSEVGVMAYRANPLEREAYDSQTFEDDGVHCPNITYLAMRRPFAWVGWVPRAWPSIESK